MNIPPGFAKHSLRCSYRLCPPDTEQPQTEVGGVLTEKQAMGWSWGLEAPEATKAGAGTLELSHTHLLTSLHMTDSHSKVHLCSSYNTCVCVIISLIPNYKTRPLRTEPLLHSLTDLQ